ncbi:MAG: PAS domain S-box protein, partial [Candidatus Eremiobacteraeota bacterium]|nr:PAS domain S-box protein [Candidatus Eremiobacteraeota bacterium]
MPSRLAMAIVMALASSWRVVNRASRRARSRDSIRVKNVRTCSTSSPAMPSSADRAASHSSSAARSRALRTCSSFADIISTFILTNSEPPANGLGRSIDPRQEEPAKFRRTPTSLMVSADRFALLESAPDAIVVVGTDGLVSMANKQTETMFGYRRDELIGRPIDHLVPERLRAAHIGHRTGFVRDPRTRPMGVGLDLFGR